MKIVYVSLTYRKPLVPLVKAKVQYIIVHHPAWISASVETIHRDVLSDPAKANWNGFPYNAYIRKDGTVYIMRGFNIGAQCAGMNSISYGVSFEGDYDKETTMPEVQYKAGVEFIRSLLPEFPNLDGVVPHREKGKTSCPGKFFPMDRLVLDVFKPDPVDTHWAEKHWANLNRAGISISEKRFDDRITRGEVFALLDRFNSSR